MEAYLPDTPYGVRGRVVDMRTYAVRLSDGSYGPEFNSTAEAGVWGTDNLRPRYGSIRFEIAYLRDGREVGHCTFQALCRDED